jgi:hypothetical protein
MNYDLSKLADIVAIIAGVGTFISALIAAITVIEIKRQRRSSYMPDVILDTYVAFWYWDRSIKEESSFEFKRARYNEWKKQKDRGEKQIHILYQLQNIGQGVAKYIRSDWRFDYKKAVKKVEEVLPEGYRIKLADEGRVVLMRNADELLDSMNLLDLESDHFDFLLPEGTMTSAKESALPQICISLYLYYVIFKYGNDKAENEEFIYEDFAGLPEPEMIITYRDIRNKQYKKKFVLGFKLANTKGHPECEENEIGVMHIIVKEK